MAEPPPPPPPPQEEATQPPPPPRQPEKKALPIASVRYKHPEIKKFVVIVALVIVSLAGLTVAIVWIPFLPKKLEFSVERASIRGYNLTSDGRLTATLALVVRAVSPHRDGFSFYYKRIDAAAWYKDQALISGRGAIPPFYQPKRNATDLNLNLAARDSTAVSASAARDLEMERGTGSLNLGVKIRAKMLLKLGALKVIHRTLKVSCGSMKIPFSSSSKIFQRVVCDTDMSG